MNQVDQNVETQQIEPELQRDPELAARLFGQAMDIEEAGDRAQLIALLRQAHQADPMDTQISFKLAYHLELVGEEEEALALYETCCEAVPAHVNALINLAVIYEDHGEYTKAEKCLRQVLDTNPNHIRAKLFYKDVVASRGMYVDEDRERRLEKQNSLLETPISDFELSVRARNCLKKMNIRSLGDLLRTSEAELLAYKNFGETSLSEIKSMLAQKGLRLGQAIEGTPTAGRPPINPEDLDVDEEILNTPVSDLQLSVRSRKALSLLSIQTIGQLINHTEAELLGIKNFGQTSLLEIRQKLGERSLKLRTIDG